LKYLNNKFKLLEDGTLKIPQIAYTFYKQLNEAAKREDAKLSLVKKIKEEEDLERAFSYVLVFEFAQRGFRLGQWGSLSASQFMGDKIIALKLLGIEVPDIPKEVITFLEVEGAPITMELHEFLEEMKNYDLRK